MDEDHKITHNRLPPLNHQHNFPKQPPPIFASQMQPLSSRPWSRQSSARSTRKIDVELNQGATAAASSCNKKTVFIAIALIALAILVAVGVVAGVLVGQNNGQSGTQSDKDDASGTTTHNNLVSTTAHQPAQTSNTVSGSITLQSTSRSTLTAHSTSEITTISSSQGSDATSASTISSNPMSTSSTGMNSQSTTSTPPILVIDDPNPIEYSGSWGAWSEYTSCPVTCGGNYQSRTRNCETENLVCVGTATQIQPCGQDPCPPTVVYGTWSTWSVWDTCSVSCGTGSQSRTRTCDMQGADQTCIGNTTQAKVCNDFSCPDCSLVCTEGTLSADCSFCECSNTYSLQVMNTESLTLANATIAPKDAPYNVLTTTGVNGHFTITNQCSQTLFSITRSGYITQELTGTELASRTHIYLQKIVPLTITKHPEDRTRLQGESITLCCDSVGTPAADYYEWFKDEQLIFTDNTGGLSSTLELTELVVSDMGYYNCRANNDYNAVYSSDAYITVGEANDFCPSVPQSKVITLPEGCVANNSTLFDQGYCPQLPCRGETNDNGSCSEDDAYCCGPQSFSRVDIPCLGNSSLPMLVVTSCGCVPCPQPQLYLSGVAVGTNGNPLLYGEIYSNGSFFGQTSDSGDFNFEIPIGTRRMVLLFKDTILEELLDTIYVVDIPKGADGTLYANVKMLPKAAQFDITSTTESEITLTSNQTGASIANLTIPENSFYSEDGTLYTGVVTASIGVIDPDDLDSVNASPGDFSTIDEEGNVQQMETYGMIHFEFKDESGNKLDIPGDITISVSSSQIGNDTDEFGMSNVKLWRINIETGVWELESDIVQESESSRKKRQISSGTWGQTTYRTTIRGLSIQTSWFNFDSIRNTACYSKIRVFKNNFFNPSEQLTGAKVSVVVKTDRNVNSISSFRAWTDSGDTNGYCIIHACDNPRSAVTYGFRGWIFASYGNPEVQLYPADPQIGATGLSNTIANSIGYSIEDDNKMFIRSLNLRRVLNGGVSSGPFYDWGDGSSKLWPNSRACSNAPFSNNHFRFSAEVCETEHDTVSYSQRAGGNCIDEYFLLWYNIASHETSNEDYVSCFVKVLTEDLANVKVKAVSKVRNKRTRSSLGDVGNDFGTRQDCPDETVKVTCVEVKGPTDMGCGLRPIDKVAEDQTAISIYTIGQNEQMHLVQDVNANLMSTYSSDIVQGVGSQEFRMYVGQHDYGPSYGIYWGRGSTKDAAQTEAKQKCLAASHTGGNSAGTTSNGWAVKFG